MLKTLDRYIIRQFLGTFFFILVLIMLIAVVFDISEKTEDFAETSASVYEIAWTTTSTSSCTTATSSAGC
jgi:lipopolysaccharide export system permease protein